MLSGCIYGGVRGDQHLSRWTEVTWGGILQCTKARVRQMAEEGHLCSLLQLRPHRHPCSWFCLQTQTELTDENLHNERLTFFSLNRNVQTRTSEALSLGQGCRVW